MTRNLQLRINVLTFFRYQSLKANMNGFRVFFYKNTGRGGSEWVAFRKTAFYIKSEIPFSQPSCSSLPKATTCTMTSLKQRTGKSPCFKAVLSRASETLVFIYSFYRFVIQIKKKKDIYIHSAHYI